MKHLYNWISIKKLLTIMFLLLLLFFLIYSVYTYHTLEASKVVDGDKTEQFVLEETELISIENIYQFQGEEAFHIVAGKNDAGDECLLFVPLDDSLSKDSIIAVSSENILSQDKIEKEWQKNCSQCKLMRSHPAMIGEKPLWELTYTDRSNRYVIEYINLEDGTIYEQLKLFRKYSERG